MVKKRKISTDGEVSVKANKKVKKVSESTGTTGKLECESAEGALVSLLSPNKVQDFFATVWEKKHLHIKRNDPDYYGNLFSLEVMKQILDEEEIHFETDVNVCRYVNGEKELLNEEGELTMKEFDNLIKDKQATFQFHQPQRYCKGLWKLMEKMETYFGSLVGSNVYITPPNSQGLAPHCDDVEIFVLQLEGKKTWKLYKPMVELSRDYTQDLTQDSIGDPIYEATLQPGDLLYFPRGTIHQAKTTSEGHSTHISISTYQQNTWGDFMSHAVTQAIENALEDDVGMRTGLPVNYSKFLGTGRNMSKYVEDDNPKIIISNEHDEIVKNFKESIKIKLAKLIDHIDVNTAADSMCADFMASRLPPFGHLLKEDVEDVEIPSLDDEIKLRYPEHVRVVFVDDDEEECTEVSNLEDDDSDIEEVEEKQAKKTKKKSIKSDDESSDEEDEDANLTEEVPYIKIVHSLNNSREGHMIGNNVADSTNSLKLPLHFAKAAVSLLNTNDFVRVKDLNLEDDADKLTLATTLFSDDLIKMKS